MTHRTPRKERVMIGGHPLGHASEEKTDDEQVMRRYKIKKRNKEGQNIMNFAKQMEVAI